MVVTRTIGRLARRRATLEQATQLAAGVEWARQFWNGRCACPQVATGAFLAGACMGMVPYWCFGARFEPELLLHFWVESADGEPVETEPHMRADGQWPFQAAVRFLST